MIFFFFVWLNKIPSDIMLTLEQHGLELHGATYMWIIFPTKHVLHDAQLVEFDCSYTWILTAWSRDGSPKPSAVQSQLYIHHIFFIHPSVDGQVGFFHVSAIINGAAMIIRVHVSFRIRVFIFSRHMPRDGIVGSYGNSIFSFLRKLYTLSPGLSVC